MGDREPLRDVIVILPGITGSVLRTSDGKDAWALSGSAIMRGVVSLGRSIDRLKLPAGFGDGLPLDEGDGTAPDGVTAPRLMSDLHVIPGLWAPIKGYSELVDELRRRFEVIPPTEEHGGNLIEFPYDWRLSNAVAARAMAATVLPALERWQRSVDPEAKLVLICHSMGGLVARWFLEVLGGWEHCRWLVTIGTPYQGAVNAIDSLVNGVSKGLGPLRRDLSSLVRSWPSVYELLPTYKCVQAGADEFVGIADSGGLGLDSKMLASAAQFHATIAEFVGRRGERGYRVAAIKGVGQPTSQSVRPTATGQVELLETYGSRDLKGDGTVPRPSAHPPEWPTELAGHSLYASQRHSTLQTHEGVLIQLFGLLTSDRLGQFLGGTEIGLKVPTLSLAGASLVVTAVSEDPTLALFANVNRTDDGAQMAESRVLSNLGGGTYQAEIVGLPPGTYEVSVGSNLPAKPVDPVSDIVVVWDGIV